jgi:hypothetical protein
MARMSGKITSDNTAMALDSETVSILQSIFDCPGNDENEPALEDGYSKTASMKFMITMQDEKDLLDLGYSAEQIWKMKPQEAGDILMSVAKAVGN